MPTTLTLTTREDLRLLIGLHVDHPTREVASELAALAAETQVAGDHVALVFRDPLDALLGWRHLDRTFREQASLMSVVASPAAMEMLHDPSDLARATLEALMARVTGAPAADGLFVVATLRGLQYRPVPDEVETSPGGIVLAVIGGDRADRVVQLTQPGWIGRARNAPIRIADANISNRHIELGVDSHDGWFARDASSTSGWYLANQRAGQQRHRLHTGMVLQLGPDAAIVVLS